EVADDGRNQRHFTPARAGFRIRDNEPAHEINERRERHQQHKQRIPPAVKDVARYQQRRITLDREKVVNEEDGRQKIKDEYIGGEYHRAPTPARLCKNTARLCTFPAPQ